MQLDPRDVIRPASNLSGALTLLAEKLAPDGSLTIFFGFFVNLDAMLKDDIIFEFSHRDESFYLDIKDLFLRVGGAREDIHAPSIPGSTEVYSLDLPALAAQMRHTEDKRVAFVSRFLEEGLQTTWLVPFHVPWALAYGTLNFFSHERFAASPLPTPALSSLASGFFDAAQEFGLISKSFRLTQNERRTLQSIANGNSTSRIAMADHVSVAAVQRRIDRVKVKLSARSRDEAVYKALVYGALPF